MERVVGTFEHLLQQLADPASLDPANNRTLGDINPASSEDVAQVANWNEHVPPAVDDCMHHMVERMAQQRPSAEAVCADALGLSLSYQQLNDIADKLALHLVEKGAGPGRIVPFMFEKSPWVIPSLLAINKAGAAFAPLDPAHQWQDTQGLLQACEATFVLCSPTHQSRFAEHGVDAVVVDPALFDSLPSPDGTVSVTQARPADPGYVIFTSGSSGTPKGVICSHSAWCTNTAAHGPREFHSTETRLLQFSAYTFDISITDMFTTLAFGGTVCVPSEHERLNDVAGAINRMRVNHAALTPTVARFLRPKGVPTLKVLITGGEEMPEEIMSLWVGVSRLINSYGPAECTSRVACSLKSAGDIASHIGTRMGAALWVTRSHDPTRLVPIGAVGELLVEGNILGDGYLKDEEKTNAAFIAAPEWLRGLYPERAENTRLYRTGDLVQQRPDGSFIFMGRRDAQIKVHGVRLEAGHIEAKIRGELPEDASLVVDKVTIAGDDDGQVKQTLAAFIQLPNSTTPENGMDTQLVPADAAIRDFVFNLRRTLLVALPSYMVPSHILVVNTIPLGATAKVNRRALQTFARNLSAEQLSEFTGSVASAVIDGTEIEKPYTEAEAALSKLWAKVLGVDSASIGRQDSFLGLGGDSVSCMKLVSEGAAAGLRFSVADVFQCSTLAELGQLVSDGAEGGKVGTAPSFVPEPMEPFELVGGLSGFFALRGDLRKQYKLAANRVDDVLPATPMQEGLMAETVAHPEAYILQEVLKLSKDVDTDMLLDALTTLVETYPILRTCIVRLKEHGTCQVVLSESEPVEVGLFSDDLPAFLARDKKQHMGYGDPLSRFALVSDPAGEQYLVWTSHHAITDGHMHQLMLQSLERAYDNDGFEASPEAVGFNQFAKYCADPDNKAASLDHWRSEFAGFDGSHYPSCADTYEPSIDKYVSHSISLPLEQARSPVTPAILLRAAWMMVLSQANNSSELVMGVTQSGRDVDLPGIHECMGPCLATMPIRGGIEGTEALSFSQYLAKVQRQYVDAIPHQHVGLQHIRKASDECANAVGFRNLLVVQPSFANDSKLATPVLDARNAGDQLNFGLLLECTLAAGEIDIRAGFDSSLLSENEIALLMQRLEHVHSQLGKADNGALPLSSLDMVSPLDLRILESFNPDIPPLDKCLHWMIEEQAQQQPDALMVDAWDARLTYHEANEYSDRLAGVLVELGVGPEIMVPFAFEKSAWATVAIHAILKAGGACVGVDMAHPRERHQRIMEDTEAVVVVASTAYAGNLEGLGVKHIVAVDRAMLDRLPPRQPAGPNVVAVSPNNPAWVVYSSGSTGTPKGSVLEHRSLCATSRTNSEILGVGPTTRAIHFASYAFDVAIEENVIIPMYGGCVCIPSDEQRLSNLPGVMQTMEINWADLTPTVARLLSPENAPFIRTLVLGGESLTKDIIDTWAGIDNIKLFNTYGPSECSIQCTSSKALGRVATGANIGRPVNCKLWVVDADNPHRLLPVGATGELLIEGHIVGRGYLNQAAKTEAAFIQGLPWATADGDVDGLLRRFYRTGDLAKFNHDGTLDCLGRQDSQIKLHGQRIELGEIEYNITKRLAVPDAAQVAVEAFSPGGSSRKLLAAFIQFAETDSAYSADETPRSSPSGLDVMEMHDALRKELLRIKSETAQHLPVYMIPSLIIPLHLMPTNTSGKIDRKKLREEAGKFDPRRLALYSLSETVQLAARETESRAQVQVQTSFSSPAERALAGLWAETMGIDLAETPIGPDDSFLELGGDSITAMQLVGKAMSAGLGLSVSRILKAPTLRDMAAAAVVTDERALLALEAPELSESESEPEVSFSSPAERALAGLWAETMGIDLAETPIGPDDSFLELGGDSITAMQLVGKATAAGLGLSVSHILRAPKLRDMAVAAVVSDERALLAFEAPGLSPVAVPPPLPTISVNDFTQLLTINTAVPSDPVSTGSNSPWMTPPETPFTDLAYFPFQLISTKASVADVLTMVATKCNLDRELVQDVYPATPLQGPYSTSVGTIKKRR
jgi:amino acid adenylation domain-containing protein